MDKKEITTKFTGVLLVIAVVVIVLGLLGLLDGCVGGVKSNDILNNPTTTITLSVKDRCKARSVETFVTVDELYLYKCVQKGENGSWNVTHRCTFKITDTYEWSDMFGGCYLGGYLTKYGDCHLEDKHSYTYATVVNDEYVEIFCKHIATDNLLNDRGWIY